MGSCGAVSCGPQSGAGNGYANAGYDNGGVQIIDTSGINEWEKNDTGSIVWGMAMGVGMNSSTVAPIAFPRYNNTSLANPTFYNTGARGYDFYARPHGP